MATIGEAIDAKVEGCVGLYERFRQDDEFRDQAGALATHDLVMQRYIALMALERVEEYIRMREGGSSVEEGSGTVCFGRGQEGGEVCFGRKREEE